MTRVKLSANIRLSNVRRGFMPKKMGRKMSAAAMKRKHGADCFKRWGKKGGNPILLKGK